jgi:hypothetical protein
VKPNLDKNSIAWGYTLRVHAVNVPLTDHLVISVLGPSGEFLGRVTFDLRAALKAPPGPMS